MNENITGTRMTIGFSTFLSAVLVAVLTKDQIDTALKLFICAYALAIPALFAFIFVGEEYQSNDEIKPNTGPHYLMGAAGGVGYIGGLFGIVALFWHFSLFAASLFLASIPLWGYLVFKYVLKKYITYDNSLKADAQKQ